MRIVYGKGANDPGQWFVFGDLEARIRKISLEDGKKLARRYGKEVPVTGQDGIKRLVIDRSPEEKELLMLDQATFALTEVRGEGASFAVGDVDGASQWANLLGEDVNAGDTINLEGRTLNEAVKRAFMTKVDPHAVVTLTDPDTGATEQSNLNLAAFVILRALELKNERVTLDEAIAKN